MGGQESSPPSSSASRSLRVGSVFDNQGAMLALANVAAQLPGLDVGQEPWPGIAEVSWHEDVDAAIGFAGGEVLRVANL